MAKVGRGPPDLQVVDSTMPVVFDHAVDTLLVGIEATGQQDAPRLRTDLHVRDVGGGFVEVRAPESTVAFKLYELEWRIARLMDGKRSLGEISTELADAGFMASVKHVRAFLGELRGYRFLVDQGASQPAVSGPAPDDSVSPEERQLIEAAVAQHTRGDDDAAANYLLAALEINPGNHDARLMLRKLRSQEPGSKGRRDAAVSREAPRPQRRWASGVVVLAGVVLGVGGVSAYVFSRRQPPPAVVKAQVKPVPTQPAAKEVTHRVRLSLANATRIAAPRDAVVKEVVVQDEARVAAGAPLVRLVARDDYQRLIRAKQKSRSVQGWACRDPAYRALCNKVRGKIEDLERGVSVEEVRAPRAGVIGGIVARAGATVSRGTLLLELHDTSRVFALLPSSLAVGGVEAMRCRVLDATFASVSCTVSLAADGQSAILVFDNTREELVPGQLLAVAVSSDLQTGLQLDHNP